MGGNPESQPKQGAHMRGVRSRSEDLNPPPLPCEGNRDHDPENEGQMMYDSWRIIGNYLLCTLTPSGHVNSDAHFKERLDPFINFTGEFLCVVRPCVPQPIITHKLEVLDSEYYPKVMVYLDGASIWGPRGWIWCRSHV